MTRNKNKLTVSPLLFDTLCIQSKSGVDGAGSKMMEEFIMRTIEGMGGITIEVDDRNIYATKGEAELYPCVVCHTDTVHSIVENFLVLRAGYLYMGFDLKTAKQIGVGGDDKVGVAIALACLRDMDHVKAVFFRDEEIGCLGAKKAKLDFFKDVSFVAEADRQGVDDVVIGISDEPLASKDFILEAEGIVQVHGRKWTTNGMGTDVGTLKDIGLDLSVINMSCGYFNPHSSWETVSPSSVDATYGFMRDLFAQLGDRQWPFVRPPKAVVKVDTKSARVPSYWPDEMYFDDLIFSDPRSLDDAWVKRAEARRKTILQRQTVPFNATSTESLVATDIGYDGKPITEWIISRQDGHIVKRVKKVDDLDIVRCPCCQFMGPLVIEFNEEKYTAIVVCDYCGVNDVVIIEHQQFVGDFITKDRSPISLDAKRKMERRPAIITPDGREFFYDDDPETDRLTRRVNRGWFNDILPLGD